VLPGVFLKRQLVRTVHPRRDHRQKRSNLAALHAVNASGAPIKVRQVKYLNNVVEQDHRAIKRRTRPMLGFKAFDCARVILSGIEVMHMIKKGQMKDSAKSHCPPRSSSTRSLHKQYIAIEFARPSRLTATKPPQGITARDV